MALIGNNGKNAIYPLYPRAQCKDFQCVTMEMHGECMHALSEYGSWSFGAHWSIDELHIGENYYASGDVGSSNNKCINS